MIVLGIETSCDETAAAVVKDGEELLSHVVLSSMDLHKAFGGVVPEIAARSHVESIIPVIEQAVEQALCSSTKFQTTNDKQIPNSKTENSSSRPNLKSLDPWDQIDAIAVTYGAGLGGSLLVGVMTARTLAITKNKPLYAINHVEAHVYANFLTRVGENAKCEIPNPNQTHKSQVWKLHGQTYRLPTSSPKFPLLALIVSGGHSQLVLFRDHFDYTLLGQTRDDAIGEAFDKVAKIAGLPYPGGPSIAKAAEKGDPHRYNLPKSKLTGNNTALTNLRTQHLKYQATTEVNTKFQTTNDKQILNSKSKKRNSPKSSNYSPSPTTSSYDFSFSGIKTAVLRLAQEEIDEDYTFPSYKLAGRLSEAQKADIAASFQRVAVETVVDKTIAAVEEFQPKSVVIAGGVAANQELRRQLTDRLTNFFSEESPSTSPSDISSQLSNMLQYTDIKLCTDNGAMIATLGCFKANLGQAPADPYTLQIQPNLSM